MNKRNKIIVSIVGITIVLLALLGITYAYYLTRIEGNTNTNSISLTTADLKLEYGDGNGLLTAENIMPGKQVEFKTTSNQTTTEKTFTVTNSGNSTIEGYAISLDYAYIENVMPSIFERPEDFQITLTCSTNRTGETCNGFTGNFNNESIMLTSNDIEKDEVHTYSLSIYYNDPQVDQSNDMGKNLNLKVQIYNIGETTDIEGTITGVDSTYAVRIESEPKMSTIVNGKYNFKGIERGTHTLTVLDESGNEIDKEYIVVKSGTEAGISSTKATINEEEVDAIGITITKDERVAKLTTKVENSLLSFDITTSTTGVFNPYSNNKNSLAYQIINNAVDKTSQDMENGIALFSPTPLSSPGSLLLENEATVSIVNDNYGSSYYFRGNVLNNFVNFAGMCWRIVRIQGDGSIRLILQDQYTTCESDSFTGDWRTSGTVFYGHDVKAEKTYAANFLESAALHYQGFQNSNLKTFIDYMKPGDWCVDDKKYSDINGATLLDTPDYNSKYYYESAIRYAKGAPSYKCFGKKLENYKNNEFMYTATLTLDEVMFAGQSKNDNKNYYLINPPWLDEETGYLFVYLLTPESFNSEEYFHCMEENEKTDYAYTFWEDGISTSPVCGDYGGSVARPAITLKSGILTEGISDGTQTNPYIIKTNS